jgi:hypothetical protein
MLLVSEDFWRQHLIWSHINPDFMQVFFWICFRIAQSLKVFKLLYYTTSFLVQFRKTLTSQTRLGLAANMYTVIQWYFSRCSQGRSLNTLPQRPDSVRVPLIYGCICLSDWRVKIPKSNVELFVVISAKFYTSRYRELKPLVDEHVSCQRQEIGSYFARTVYGIRHCKTADETNISQAHFWRPSSISAVKITSNFCL